MSISPNFLPLASLKPILFSRAMIEAILAGRKTMTRRMLNPQPSADWKPFGNMSEVHKMVNGQFVMKNGSPVVLGYGFSNEDGSEAHVAKFKEGDILWVRETTYIYGKYAKAGISKKGRQKWKFVADKTKKVLYPTDSFSDECMIADRKTPKDTLAYWKRPSIFMPKWACRIYLRVTNVKCERLCNITLQDILNEGCPSYDKEAYVGLKVKAIYAGYPIEKEILNWWVNLWNAINGKDAWTLNSYVLAYSFEQVEKCW
ncbi:MAG: hypothetical protein RBR02_11030 [Desulfuromonadaceae bacterium]|nr:hypothetical protein [Desulfuromonadaceae bacterium]